MRNTLPHSLEHDIYSHLTIEGIMKTTTVVGLLLVILAIVGFAVGGISFTHQKKDVDMGPVQLSHNETNTVPISPILSTICLIAGVGLVVAGVRAKA
jgi:hypothetical protein